MTTAQRSIVIAIDGPAGAGKSTVAKAVAAKLGYRLVDTGAVYRSVALVAECQGIDWHDESRLASVVAKLNIAFAMVDGANRTAVDGHDVSDDIRRPEISQGASIVSALPRVRAGLLGLQRRLAAEGGVVLEGRDIGTVVCPQAELKIFLGASIEERARRRHRELLAAGRGASYEDVLADIGVRDARDTQRDVAPLVPAADAILLDSTVLSVEEVVERIIAAAATRR